MYLMISHISTGKQRPGETFAAVKDHKEILRVSSNTQTFLSIPLVVNTEINYNRKTFKPIAQNVRDCLVSRQCALMVMKVSSDSRDKS